MWALSPEAWPTLRQPTTRCRAPTQGIRPAPKGPSIRFQWGSVTALLRCAAPAWVVISRRTLRRRPSTRFRGWRPPWVSVGSSNFRLPRWRAPRRTRSPPPKAAIGTWRGFAPERTTSIRAPAIDLLPERSPLPVGCCRPKKFRAAWRQQVREAFSDVDISPYRSGDSGVRHGTGPQEMMTLGGASLPVRANLGLFTQPISFIGLPVIASPVHTPGRLPIGVQLIAAPWREAALFRVARILEREGVCSSPIATIG